MRTSVVTCGIYAGMMELRGVMRQVGAMQYVRVREAQPAYASEK